MTTKIAYNEACSMYRLLPLQIQRGEKNERWRNTDIALWRSPPDVPWHSLLDKSMYMRATGLPCWHR